MLACCLVFSAGAGSLSAAPVGQQWWRGAWSVRVPLALADRPGKPTLPGADVAVAEFFTAGLLQPDGRDLRVTTDAGQPTPHRVLQVGPGDVARVAFAVVPGRQNYFAYFGNPAAKAPGEDAALDIRRGVLLEVWAYAGGAAGTFAQAVATVNKAGRHRRIGRGFRSRVFSGHNPFGPGVRIAAVYTAWLIAPAAGRYAFGSCSRNASFVVVDETLVVRNGGWHGPRRRGWPTGTIELNQGLHFVTYYHVTPWANPQAVLSWKPPGGKWHVIEPASFAPVFRATAGPMEHRGRPVAVDFEIVESGEAFLGEGYAQRRVFRPMLAGRGGSRLRWHWEFGDGQKITTNKPRPVEHVYLSPGERTVRLRVSGHSAPLEVAHRVEIDRDWDRVTSRDLEGLRRYAKIVGEYDFASLGSGDLAGAVKLFERLGELRGLLRATKAFVRRDRAEAAEVREVVEVLLPLLRAGGKSAEAVTLLLKAAGMTQDGQLKAELLNRVGRVRLDDLGQVDEAMEVFERVLREHRSDGGKALRDARIGVGDVWRARGDFQQARGAYRKAGVSDERARKFPAIVRGDYARQAEAYLRRGDLADALEAVDAWEQMLPEDKLEGYSTLLRVRVLDRLGRYAEIVREAGRLLRVNPAGAYGPDLLLARAGALRELGRHDEARAALGRLLREYPESARVSEAARLLEAMKGKS